MRRARVVSVVFLKGAFPVSRLRRAHLGVAATFLLIGFIYGTWVGRMPAVKDDLGLSDGQLAIIFTALNAGGVAGLQLGGVIVPRTGSRSALAVALSLYAALLAAMGLAGSLVVLAAVVALWAASNSVVDVAMNAHGVEVQQRYARPILSRLHAMLSLGVFLGAGGGAVASALDVSRSAHFVGIAVVAVPAAIVVNRLLLPSSVDAGAAAVAPGSQGPSAPKAAVSDWLQGWSGQIIQLGLLAFCVTLAESCANNWGAIYLRDSLGASASTAAVGVALFMAAMTAGRLAGDRLTARFGPVRLFGTSALVAGAGFGAALLVGRPVAGLLGLVLLGAGVSYMFPLAISAAGNLDGDTAPAVARISTLGYLSAFVAPSLIGGLASLLSLPAALALPALLVGGTALRAGAVGPAGRGGPGEQEPLPARP